MYGARLQISSTSRQAAKSDARLVKRPGLIQRVFSQIRSCKQDFFTAGASVNTEVFSLIFQFSVTPPVNRTQPNE